MFTQLKWRFIGSNSSSFQFKIISSLVYSAVKLTWESFNPNRSASFFLSGLLMYFCIWKRFSNPFRCESKTAKKQLKSWRLFFFYFDSKTSWNVYLKTQPVSSCLVEVSPLLSVPMENPGLQLPNYIILIFMFTCCTTHNTLHTWGQWKNLRSTSCENNFK